MRLRGATCTALLPGVLISCSGPWAFAEDAASRVQVLRLGGHFVTGAVRGVPAVGDGPAIRRYHDSGRFTADRAAVAVAAQDELFRLVALERPTGPRACSGARLAIVVDVDDTLLDWYGPYARQGFDPSGTSRQAAVQSCATRATAPVREFVDRAEALGVSVLVISGRGEPVRAVTMSCLARRGLTVWRDLVLRTADQDTMSSSAYKKQAYARIVHAGWNVVLSIGDQRGDLVGTESGARFLLPNPLYATR